MPEGHTVHRAARRQTRLLGGQQLAVSSPQGRFAADAARIDGSTLQCVEAYGKHLFYHWETGDVGHVHLGLFGRFRIREDGAGEPGANVRMRLATDDVTVDLSGPTICSLDPPDVHAEVIARLGPDPLRRNSSPDRMIDRISRSRRAIGDLLMDQSVIAGLGNVYRAELLFVTGVHPLAPGRTIDEHTIQSFWDTAAAMLRDGVRRGRIQTVDRAELGLPAGRRVPRGERTYVYKRDRCLRCGDAIRTVEIAGRTCYYCPTDQRQ
jgi:endonuclease-8